MEGKLIVFEGLDKSGKTTHTEMLYKWFLEKKIKVILIKFPDRETEIGKVINLYLTKQIKLCPEAAYLLFCANRWEKAEFINQKLKEGYYVITDRYSYSGIAYIKAQFQNSQNFGNFGNFEMEKGLPQPNIVFYFERLNISFDTELFEIKEFQDKVEKEFDKLNKNWIIVKKDSKENRHNFIINHF